MCSVNVLTMRDSRAEKRRRELKEIGQIEDNVVENQVNFSAFQIIFQPLGGFPVLNSVLEIFFNG